MVSVVLMAVARAQTTTCPSFSHVQANDWSNYPALSADGRFTTFTSNATNLVSGDTNGAQDVFVRDGLSGAVERVSVATNGTQGNGVSQLSCLSADGRFVVFQSVASLDSADTNGFLDVYLRDRQAGTTRMIRPGQLQLVCGSPAISADGRYVAFAAYTGSSYTRAGLFLTDVQAGTLEEVSVDSAGNPGTPGPQGSSWPAISQDGRFVAFWSDDHDLVQGDTNNAPDIFVRDRLNGTTELVSVATGGAQSDWGNTSWYPAISGDGRFVAFLSASTNLVTGDTNGCSDVFLRDRTAGTTERVSVSTGGVQGNLASGQYSVSMSADGRFVVFDSSASNLVSGDTNNATDIFVHDRTGGTTVRVDVPDAGGQADFDSSFACTSADGAHVAFASYASNLVPNDTNGKDVFQCSRSGGSMSRVSVPSLATGNSYSTDAALSPDGRFVTFVSNATNLVDNDTNGYIDAFLFDRNSGAIERVNLVTGGAEANGPTFASALSSDGRYVAFDSEATNLFANDTNGNDKDVFVRDRQTDTTELISVSTSGTTGDDVSRAPAISGDGRYVAFWSFATTLVAGDTNGHGDIFVRDRQSGTTQIASIATGGVQENNSALFPPSISADGRYVAFLSWATNLVSGDTNGAIDVFVRDRVSGTTERVSVSTGGVQGNADCYAPCAISADGRYVVFASDASNLVSGDTNGSTDVFLRDRQTGTTERVDLGPGGVQANFGGGGGGVGGGGGGAVVV
jgi:Tol biopolymer transport system component